MEIDFNIREFLDLPNQHMQLQYLQNNKQQELIFTLDTDYIPNPNDSTNCDYWNKHVCYWNKLIHLRYVKSELRLELVKRKFTVHFTNINRDPPHTKSITKFIYIPELVHNESITSDEWQEYIEIVDKNNWIQERDYQTLFYNIMYWERTCNPGIDISVKKYLISIYKKNNIPINSSVINDDVPEINNFQYNQYSISNLILILDTYKENNIPIPPDTVINYLLRQYNYLNPSNQKNFSLLIDKCIEYKIPSCIQPTINQETGTLVYNTNVLAKITEVFTNWDTVMKVINIYKDYGFPIDDIALGVASNFGPGAVKFVLDNCNRDKILALSCNDTYRAGMTFLDLIIAYNSLESLKLCIRYGIPLTNNTHELYIPCRHCHNGEPSYCNYRKITTNFISINLW